MDGKTSELSMMGKQRKGRNGDELGGEKREGGRTADYRASLCGDSLQGSGIVVTMSAKVMGNN